MTILAMLWVLATPGHIVLVPSGAGCEAGCEARDQEGNLIAWPVFPGDCLHGVDSARQVRLCNENGCGPAADHVTPKAGACLRDIEVPK